MNNCLRTNKRTYDSYDYQTKSNCQRYGVFQFYLSRTDLEQFENDENEDSQRELLARLSRRLPVQCRTASGGKSSYSNQMFVTL